MRKKKRRNLRVMLFAFRLIDYRSTVKVSAPGRATDEEIEYAFNGDLPPPFLKWKQHSDDILTLSDEAPRVIGTFSDEEPDIVLERSPEGDLQISE